MKKCVETLEVIIDKFKDYKIPKYLEVELFNITLAYIPYVKIKNCFYKFSADKKLVIVNDKDCRNFITKRKKKIEEIRFVTSLLYENSNYIIERYFGTIVTYNSETFSYKSGLIAVHLYSKQTNKFYLFGKGIYTNMSGRTIFFLLKQRIKKHIRPLDNYYYFDSFRFISKYRLKNISNKYLKNIKSLDIYDLAMINKYPKLESFYRKQDVLNINHRRIFIEYFLKNNLNFNYKIFCDVCYRNISEYIVKINYLGASFIDVPEHNYSYWNVLLKKGVDKKYLYRHRLEINYYLDYLAMRKNKGMELYPIFPKNIKKLHDELSYKIAVKKNEELINKLNLIINKHKKICFEFDGFRYYIPTFDDMVDYSNELNLCINSAGYINRMAQERCLLVFCEKINKPSKLEKFAAELIMNDGRYRINQFHGFNNDSDGSIAYLQLRTKLLNALNNRLGC